jgi:hypothetical protein
MTPTKTVLTHEALAEMDAGHPAPCLSLYQATHRRHPDNQQDPIRFRNLVKELERSLHHAYPEAEIRSLLEPFESLGADDAFWNHSMDGLAVLGGHDLFRVFHLQRPVADLAIVADSFHTNPLRRFLQSADRYQVLGVSFDRIQLFEGNRNVLDEIDPAPEVLQASAGAQGNALTEPHQSVASYGSAGGVSHPSHHSQGGPKDVAAIDAERFFRAIDRAVLEHHSRPSGLPLILASLPQHQHLFRQVSHNPFLVEEGLLINPGVLSNDALRERVWKTFEPHCTARQKHWADEFAVAKSKGLGVDDLAQVAAAAVAGQIATLLIEDGRQMPGRITAATGQVELAELSDPHVDDVLDDLGQLVLSKGGEVILVSAEYMPTDTGIAATRRF